MNEAEQLYRQGTEILDSNPAGAVEFLTKSLAINPDAPPALYNRVVALGRLGRHDEALADLERLEQISPEMSSQLRHQMALSVEPYTDIARAEYKARNFEAAIIRCDSALACDSRYGNALVVKGMSLQRLGNVDEALECYTKAARVDPGNYWAFLNRAQLYFQKKHLDGALADFTRAIALLPTDSFAYLGRAGVYAELKMQKKAAADLRMAEELNRPQGSPKPVDYAARLRMLGCRPTSKSVAGDIEALENCIGVTLPASYRQFLASCGGWCGNLLCPCREPTPFGHDHWLSGFHDAGEIQEILTSMIVPRNMVMIAYGHFEKFTCLSVAGIDRGFVYALDGEFRAYWSDAEFQETFNAMADSIREYLELRREDNLPEKAVGYESLYMIAEDFDQFLASCRSSKDPETG